MGYPIPYLSQVIESERVRNFPQRLKAITSITEPKDIADRFCTIRNRTLQCRQMQKQPSGEIKRRWLISQQIDGGEVCFCLSALTLTGLNSISSDELYVELFSYMNLLKGSFFFSTWQCKCVKLSFNTFGLSMAQRRCQSRLRLKTDSCRWVSKYLMSSLPGVCSSLTGCKDLTAFNRLLEGTRRDLEKDFRLHQGINLFLLRICSSYQYNHWKTVSAY